MINLCELWFIKAKWVYLFVSYIETVITNPLKIQVGQKKPQVTRTTFIEGYGSKAHISYWYAML